MVYDDGINFLPSPTQKKSPIHVERPKNRINKRVSLESLTRFSCSCSTSQNQQNNYGCAYKYYINSYIGIQHLLIYIIHFFFFLILKSYFFFFSFSLMTLILQCNIDFSSITILNPHYHIDSCRLQINKTINYGRPLFFVDISVYF